MNKRGAALILAFMVIMVLTILSSAHMTSSIVESMAVRRYIDSERAFWIAEAGMAKAFRDWLANPTTYSGAGTTNFAGGAYNVAKDADLPTVTVTADFGNGHKVLSALFVGIPHPFENTVSCGDDMTLLGLLARVEVYGRTRISGEYSKTWGASDWFEDRQTGVSQDLTTIRIPDYNDNGTPDEFNDFVLFGREAVASYPPQEVVYIQTDGTVNIFPNQSLVGKRVIFVEGSSPGTGNVNIFFDAVWQEEEDLAVISTGDITYIEPLQFQEDARLSTISWLDYNEASIFRSEHESVVYAHDDANFVDVLDWGSTTGNVIANDDIGLTEVLTYEKYYYSDRALNGDLPPGFQLLGGGSGQAQLRNWQVTGD
jgi:hypothetical protein